MAPKAGFHHGIEMLGRGVFVELIDGQGVQRSLLQEMVVHHGALGGFHVQKLVVVELSPLPVAVGKHRFKHGMELGIHGHHGGGQRGRTIGLRRSQLGLRRIGGRGTRHQGGEAKEKQAHGMKQSVGNHDACGGEGQVQFRFRDRGNFR